VENRSQTDEQNELRDLIDLIRRLRAPDGCPWDRKQSKKDIGKYLLDEAYELFDALDEDQTPHIQEELGDLLFLILFIAEIADESGDFSLADAMRSIKQKMIRRHPHVFDNVKVRSIQDIKDNWQEIKKRERAAQSKQQDIFIHIPRSLPALKRAQKITDVASRYGFDWGKMDEVWLKLKEELEELALAQQINDARKMEEEMGDILFTLVNLCRFIHGDAESALSGTIDKFLRRFAYIVHHLDARGRTLEEASLDEMDALWNEAKEKKG
jgi:tetrapyrrole methylase family protein/MazG family protein